MTEMSKDARPESAIPEQESANPEQEIPRELDNFRKTIDNLDAALVNILAERFRCTQQVGKLKAEHDLPASDKEREARQIARLRRLAEDAELDPVFAEKFLKFIVAEVIQHHEQIAAEKKQ